MKRQVRRNVLAFTVLACFFVAFLAGVLTSRKLLVFAARSFEARGVDYHGETIRSHLLDGSIHLGVSSKAFRGAKWSDYVSWDQSRCEVFVFSTYGDERILLYVMSEVVVGAQRIESDADMWVFADAQALSDMFSAIDMP